MRSHPRTYCTIGASSAGAAPRGWLPGRVVPAHRSGPAPAHGRIASRSRARCPRPNASYSILLACPTARVRSGSSSGTSLVSTSQFPRRACARRLGDQLHRGGNGWLELRGGYSFRMREAKPRFARRHSLSGCIREWRLSLFPVRSRSCGIRRMATLRLRQPHSY
jgi:hypothetical protein